MGDQRFSPRGRDRLRRHGPHVIRSRFHDECAAPPLRLLDTIRRLGGAHDSTHAVVRRGAPPAVRAPRQAL